MKSRTRICAGSSVVALVLGMASAEAQYYPAPYGYPPASPPAAIFSSHHADAVVRSLGLTPLGRAVPHGPMFIVPAIGQEGTRVQVMLERRSGRVVQIARIGRSAPRIVTRSPGQLPPGYDADDGEPGFFDDDDDLPPPVARRGYPVGDPTIPSGPAVIMREGIQAETLPPPGSGARIAERERNITGSISRSGRAGPVDPLLGVPKEFRGQPQRNAAPQQRTAARSPADSIPRSAPLPLPRPSDAPTVAQNESSSEPAAAPAKAPSLSPEARRDAEKFPQVKQL